jgi:four helix bundle protein
MESTKRYDLEDRTFAFARDVREFVKEVGNSLSNIEDKRQLVRASGSVGANYIEANESLSKKDFAMRIKICRKESKESRYWLRLLDINGTEAHAAKRARLEQEATELLSIFSAILKKTE